MADNFDVELRISADTQESVASTNAQIAAFRALGKVAKEAASSLTEIADEAVEAVAKVGLFTQVTQAIQSIAGALDNASKQMKKFGRDFTQNVTAPLLAIAGLALKKVFDDATNGIAGFTNGNSATNQFAASVQSLKKEFDKLLVTIGTQLAPAATKVVNFFRNLIQAYQDLSPKTKEFVLNMALIAGAVGPIVLGLSAFIGIIGKVLQVLAPVLAFLPKIIAFFTSPVVVIGSLVAAVAGIINVFLKLKEAGVQTSTALLQSFNLFVTGFNNYVTKNLLKGISAIVGGMSKLAAPFSESIGNMLKSAGEGIDETVKGLEDKFLANKKSVDDTLKTIGGSAGKAFTFGFSDTFSEIGEAFSGLGQKGAKSLDVTFVEIDDKFTAAVEKYKAYQAQIAALAQQIGEQVSGNLTNAFLDFAEGTKSAEQAFRDFARSTLRYIAELILKQQIYNSLFGVGGALRGAATGAATSVVAATGGYIRGPGTSTSDSIPARLSDGEYVTDAKTVRTLGVDFFRNLKTTARSGVKPRRKSGVQHFADGGLVGPGQGGSAPQVVINNSGAAKQATATNYDPSTAVTTVILEDISKNGSISKAIQRNFGVRRAGFR